MIDPADARKVDIALPTIVASTGSWGCARATGCPTWTADPRCGQVTMMLMRQNVPYAVTRHLRVFVDSLEGQRRLLAGATNPDQTNQY